MRRFFISAMFFSVTLFAALSPVSQSQAAGVGPGVYIREYGMGTLKVDRSDEDTLEFHIDAIGANGHSCTVDGVMRNFHAELNIGKGESGEDKCGISFTPSGAGVAVNADRRTQEQCRHFCGARASFDGNYLIPAPGCNNSARAQARKRFARLYQEKNYVMARKELEPLLENCGKTLHVFENGRVRNDLALAQYHQQDFAGCLRTLAPMKRYAGMSREQLRNVFDPIDAESMAPILKATATNLDLCMAKNGR